LVEIDMKQRIKTTNNTLDVIKTSCSTNETVILCLLACSITVCRAPAYFFIINYYSLKHAINYANERAIIDYLVDIKRIVLYNAIITRSVAAG